MGTCATVPSDGVQLASACSQSSNCESGFCDEETFLCSERRALPGASQAARMRTKRDGTSGGYTNPKNKRGKMSAWFKSHTFCTAGQTACSTVGGYDVSRLILIQHECFESQSDHLCRVSSA
jgi:hypothetical protein